MIKVWGRKNSSNVQKVMWAIGELGLGHERVDIGGPFGGNKDAPYLAMNPNGLIPTIQDGDLTLWESNAIVRYLSAVYGVGKLQPADAKKAALCGQWMDWQLAVVAPAITPAFLGLVRTPPEKRDNAAIAASQAKTVEAMSMLEAALGRTSHVAGDAFTMADIPLGIMAYRYWQLVPQHPAHPNLKRWYGQIEARPAFKTHVSSIPMT
ncbi:MAG: glutathione S-transferase family protein [Alphaproteobacteria bacterium]|nr:glutathione S-transferase family protein [Alphaproteobacteria bacterium]